MNPTEPRLIKVQPHTDSRGCFHEVYHQERYRDLGIEGPFVQDNFSRSCKDVLRGLHFQEPAQGKLVQVLFGTIWDVVVDLRPGALFKLWTAFELDNTRQLWVPPGFAHGFCVLSESADVFYKCTEVYTPGGEHAIAWDDPELKIPWPVKNPVLSEKDRNAASFYSAIKP